MRDIALTIVVFGSVPFILRWPHVGVLMWTWLAFMNPHRLTWSFAYTMKFALVIALCTLVALIFTKEEKRIPWTRETILMVLFLGWMTLTTVFAVYQHLAWVQLEKVAKIFLMVLVTAMLMRSKERINLLVWVMTLSLAFYGIKGGIFTVLRGGIHHVRGPSGSFIGGDNEMGLALIMTVPLLRYLQLATSRAWVKHAMTCAMLLSALAAIGSLSRGAFLGIAAMGLFLWLKGRNKFFMGLLGGVAVFLVVSIMPQQWFDRMATIQNYEEDRSAMGRISAWKTAINVAMHRPLGAGFEPFHAEVFAAYGPEPDRVHDAHSIYFEVLGEHGFVGLALFLALGVCTWRSASWIIRRARGDPRHHWAADLAAMVQVSLVGYACAGAFLGLAYFDLYYTLIAVVVLCKAMLLAEDAKAAGQVRGFSQPASAPAS